MASTATNGASATANVASNGTSNGAANGAVHGAEKGGKLLAGVDLGAKAVTDFIDGKMKGHDFSAGDAFSLIGKALKAFWDPEAAASAEPEDKGDTLSQIRMYMYRAEMSPKLRTLFDVGLELVYFIDYARGSYSEAAGDERFLRAESGHRSQIEYLRPEIPTVDPAHLPGSYKALPSYAVSKPLLYSQMLGHTLTGIGALFNMMAAKEYTAQDWTAIFHPNHFPMPPTVKSMVETWQEDYEFCRHFLQGINPFLIKIVTDIAEVPEEMRKLTAPPEKSETAPASLADLIATKRLLIVDFKELAVGEPSAEGYYRGADQTDYIFYAPYVLFYRTDEPSSPVGHNLKPLGIQLTRLKEENKVYTPNSKGLTWLYAKTIVQNADANYMELVNHLGLGHLTLEPICIAYYNWTARGTTDEKNALIRRMLGPHMDRTLAINRLARLSLLASNELSVDYLLSTGVVNGVKAFSNKFRQMEMSDMNLPQQLAKRGFGRDPAADGVKGYFFRDDGFQLWDALHKYVEETVNSCYKTDAEVKDNAGLQEFLAEIGDPEKGNLPPFRGLTVDTRKGLTEVLTSIIFHASAFHAVQNNTQFDYLGFVPGKPLTLKYHPVDDPELTMEKIYATLPDTFTMMKQILSTYLLSSDTDQNLDTLNILEDCLPEAHFGLKRDFVDLSHNIEKRNLECQRNKEVPYPYFLPYNCNSSINI